MQFMILNYSRDGASGAPGEADDMPAWMAYTKALMESGVMVSGDELVSPSEAVTLRVRNGARDLQDGPYAEAKEQLGGYYVIDVPDMETALEWAARCPSAATGAVEVRRIVVHDLG